MLKNSWKVCDGRESRTRKNLSRLGWIGFGYRSWWVDSLTLDGLCFRLHAFPSGPRAGLAIVEYLTVASLLILILPSSGFTGIPAWPNGL